MKSIDKAVEAERDVEIEFLEWIHPIFGVVPVDPKTPLILKVKIRDKTNKGQGLHIAAAIRARGSDQ